MKQIISIATWLMLLILAGCSDASPYAEEPSAQERTITLNLDITTRADELLPDNSEPDIIRLWIFDNNNENLITYVVSSQNVWTPVGTDGIDIKTTLQTEIEAENIDVKQSLKIYLLLNQPYTDDGKGSTAPVDFSDVKTLDELKGKMFVLTEYKGDNKVPMTGEGTANFSSVEGNKIIFKALINATRCVAKLGIYCTKSSEESFLAIKKIALDQEPNKGYLLNTGANDISYNKSRILWEGFTFVDTYLLGNDLPSDNELENINNQFTSFSDKLEQPYLLENVYGGENLQVDNMNFPIEDSELRYYISLTYTIDGNSYIEKKIYLSQIKRNTLYKIFIRIKSPIETDISYVVVQPWSEFTIEVPTFD